MYPPTNNLLSLVKIFHCESKRELEKYCRNLTIYQQDFVAMIMAAQRGAMHPYMYANHFARTFPDHLITNEKEQSALAENGIGEFKTKEAKKFASKSFQLFHEQRSLAAHLFYTQDHRYWNLFYFDNRDLAQHSNHWEFGAHIHFVSDLWSGVTLDDAWSQIKSGNIKISGKLHIRYNVKLQRANA